MTDRLPATADDGRWWGRIIGMTDPEQSPDVEQRLAEDLDPERHRAPSEGIPQDLPEDEDEDPEPA